MPYSDAGADAERRDQSYKAAQARRARLNAARTKGTHTKADWKILHDVFGRCVNCGIPYDILVGGAATKDHIVPLYADGCDCVANLQPVCRHCNSHGIFADLRDVVLPGWQTIYLHRLGAYF
jgi:5-methylcytosine-specific restriction endonuclease McrA